MSILKAIAESIKTTINDEDFSQEFTATREYVPALDTVSTGSVVVQVIPKARGIAPLTKIGGPVENRYEVDIGVFQAATGSKSERDAIADAGLLLVQEIADFWMKNAITIESVILVVVGVVIEPVFDLEILKDKGIFASVMTLSLQEVRG